ncbi:MAG TPA: hypothetical protein V6D28_16560 [Leptolyngbyaceae cyanobacterium]
MLRLNKRAFGILAAEVKKCAGSDPLSKIEQDIVLKDLEKLRSQKGSSASLEEMRRMVVSTYPNFSEKSLLAAAKANRPASLWSKVKLTAIVIVGTVVGLGVLASLYPIPETAENRADLPEKKKEPKLPNPSRLSTDENYKQAISLVEQAERLITQATAPADLALGEEKLIQAKKHIDQLPVSYYSSEPYITRKGKVRYHYEKVYDDKFSSLRSQVEEMQAQVFQEKQAQEQLQQIEQALDTTKQQYQEAQTPAQRSTVVASWQANLDRLKQISDETLAGKTARAKLITYERNFVEFSGIEAAKQFAMEAAKLGQNPPHLAAKWQQVENHWQEAINRLEQLTERDSGYIEAQNLLATYRTNLGTVQIRRQAEETSAIALKEAKEQITSLLATSTNQPFSAYKERTIGQMQEIISQLQQVKPGTTAHPEAQQLLISARNKLKQLQPSLPATNFGN